MYVQCFNIDTVDRHIGPRLNYSSCNILVQLLTLRFCPPNPQSVLVQV